MTDQEFDRLVNGPLMHPYPMFAISRLRLALRCVLDAAGPKAEEALLAHCAERERQDLDQVRK